MRNCWSFHSAGRFVFGRGAVQHVGQFAEELHLDKLLLITDQRLMAAGLLEQTLGPLRAAGMQVQVFEDGEPEPSIELAHRATEFAKQHAPQGILALGGGSNIDLAKMVAVLYTHGGTAADYFGFNRVPGPILPLICLPTTAGTGSEVSHAAVLTDPVQHLKISTLSQHMRPQLAVVDPALTDGCPQRVTADSGIDALTHAVEAYTATDYQRLQEPDDAPLAYEGRYPLGECLAEKAISLVGQHLETAVHTGTNTVARDGMALAASLAGLAFSNCGVALVHALEYPLGGAVHCSHGAGNGLLLPHVMRYILPFRVAALANIARLLGVKVDGLSEHAAAERAIQAVDQLRERIGVPARLRDLGAKREQLPTFAAKSFSIKRLIATTPRPVTEADLLAILEAAY